MIYSIDLRCRVVNFVKAGGSKAEASRHFQVSKKTVFNWLNKKDLMPVKVTTRKGKINKEELIKFVEDNSDTTLFEVSEKFKVSIAAISKMFKKLKIVKKNDAIQGKKLYTKE